MKASVWDDTPLHHQAWLPADDDGTAKTQRRLVARPTLHVEVLLLNR